MATEWFATKCNNCQRWVKMKTEVSHMFDKLSYYGYGPKGQENEKPVEVSMPRVVVKVPRVVQCDNPDCPGNKRRRSSGGPEV